MSRINLRNGWYNDLIGRYDYDSDESLDDFGPDPLPPPLPPPPPPVYVPTEPDAMLKECDQPSLLPIFSGATSGDQCWHERINGNDTFVIYANTYTAIQRCFFIPFMVNATSRAANVTNIQLTMRCNKPWQPGSFTAHLRPGVLGTLGSVLTLPHSPVRTGLDFFDADTDIVLTISIPKTLLTQFFSTGVRLLSIMYNQNKLGNLGPNGLYNITKIVSYLPLGYKIRTEDFFTMTRESPPAFVGGTAMSVFDVAPTFLPETYRFRRPIQQPFIGEGPPLKMVGWPLFGDYLNEVDSSPFELCPLLQPGDQSERFISVWPLQFWTDGEPIAAWNSLQAWYQQIKSGVAIRSQVTAGCKVYGCYMQEYTEKYEGVGYLPP